MEKSLPRQIADFLGQNYKVKESVWEDGPPFRTKIMKKIERKWLFFEWKDEKEIGYIRNNTVISWDIEFAKYLESGMNIKILLI